MEKIKRRIQAVILVLFPLFLAACFSVSVVENVKSPSRYFKKAYRQIERIHDQYPNREGRPRSIHILIYEEPENKLIRVSAPFWMVNACLDLGMWAAERGEDFDFEDQYDFDWREIRNLGQIGPGLLIDVDDQENKILIWLE